jgi:colanic acid/amylovoran biosynthesis glycosyltransferase
MDRAYAEGLLEPVPVGLFVGDWLRLSETFIYDQLRFQRDLCAHVCARSLHREGAFFPYPQVSALGLVEAAAYWASGHAPRFLGALRRAGTRLIHAHYGLNGVKALPFARALGCPLVVTFHGHDVAGLFRANRFTARYYEYQRGARRMFERASLLLCASAELAQLLIERFAAPVARVRVHRLGIDLERFAKVERPERAPTVLMVGRLVEKKGMSFGLRAFAQARQREPEARLSIVGAGPLRRALEQEARRLGIAEAVRFMGALPSEGVRAAMLDADVLLCPSVETSRGDRESGVLVLKEAAATGLSTIGTCHGGIPEIIEHGQTGFLVPERDVGALAEALRELLGSHALRTRLGEAARAKMEREYDARRQNAALEQLVLGTL